MYVCLCKGITEQMIIDEMKKSHIKSAKDLSRRLGVGTDCGICLQDAIEKIQNRSHSDHINASKKSNS